jgi:hypothetical protein
MQMGEKNFQENEDVDALELLKRKFRNRPRCPSRSGTL